MTALTIWCLNYEGKAGKRISCKGRASRYTVTKWRIFYCNHKINELGYLVTDKFINRTKCPEWADFYGKQTFFFVPDIEY
jgi:hypothetical protein